MQIYRILYNYVYKINIFSNENHICLSLNKMCEKKLDIIYSYTPPFSENSRENKKGILIFCILCALYAKGDFTNQSCGRLLARGLICESHFIG